MVRYSIVTCIAISLISSAHAGPRILSYQGTLLDSGGRIVPDGLYDMRFDVYHEQTGGAPYWEEEDAAVPVTSGLFSTLLGDQTVFSSQFSNDYSLWLEVAVDLNGNGMYEAEEVYAPRQRLAGAAWAVEAEYLQGRRVSDFAAADHPHGWSELSDVPPGFADGVDNDSLADLSPSAGQTIRWNGSSWEPVASVQAPVAVLQAAPARIWPGETTTTLSLDLSYDPRGGPLTYAFDPYGDIVGEPASFGSNPVLTAAYAGAGDYLAAGWVKDSTGAVGRAQAMVSVFSFRRVVMEDVDQTGQYNSLLEVDGRPAVAYYNASLGDLEFVRADDALGSSWGSPVTVDSTDNVGWYASLAVVDGRPAIAYYDLTNDQLKYVRANDVDGSSWGGPVIADSAGNVGFYASMTVVNGNPAIAYYETTNDDVRYVRANDAEGSLWGSPVSVDTTDDVGRFVSMTVVNNRPAIAYYDSTNANLKYVHANDADGASWANPVLADSDGIAGQHASLAVVAGRPAIAYRKSSPGGLMYVRAGDADGVSWNNPIPVDTSESVGYYASLAVVDGYPAIAYHRSLGADLLFVRAADATGNSWGAPVSIGSADTVGSDTSLAVVNGRPAIAYRAESDIGYVYADH